MLAMAGWNKIRFLPPDISIWDRLMKECRIYPMLFSVIM